MFRKKSMTMGMWTAIGIGAGVAVGTSTGNLAVWTAIGAGLGIAVGAALGGKIEDG